jgi:hypothetical protein
VHFVLWKAEFRQQRLAIGSIHSNYVIENFTVLCMHWSAALVLDLDAIFSRDAD